MTRGGNRGCCPLQIGIDNLHVSALLCSRQIEGLAEQPLVQKPAPSGIGAGRGAPDHGLDRLWSGCLKQGFEDQQVQPFVFESEGQMSFKAGRRRVAWRVMCQPSCWYVLWSGPTADSVRGIGTFKPTASISAAYPTGAARSGSLEP